MRQCLAFYNSLCDMADNRSTLLRFPLRMARYNPETIWVSFHLFGCLYIQGDEALGVAIISRAPENIRAIAQLRDTHWEGH